MKGRFFAALVGVCFFMALSGFAHARPAYLGTFDAKYGTDGTRLDTCSLCHIGNPGNVNLNPYGQAFEAAPGFPNDAAFTAIEGADSDGDGFSNIDEINALTFPGDPADHPTAADTTPPTVTSFEIPATSDSLTVPITSFTATDNVGVTGYLVTESSATPAPSAGFTASPPTSYTFDTEGAKTLYAWAKDAANNVSTSVSGFVTITLPSEDTEPPTIPQGLTASATASSVSLSWQASSDNVGVTGYLILRDGAQIGTAATTSFVDTTVMPETTYNYTVRAQDAAGNTSADSSTVTVTTPASGGGTMPVPTDMQAFNLLPTAAPVLSVDPAQAVPIALGAYAQGAKAVELEIGLLAFSGPVDIYLGLLMPSLSPELYLFNEAGGLVPASQGLVPWRANFQPAPLDVTVVPEIPTSILAPGRYTIYLAVLPAGGSFEAFYLWSTAFTVGVPIETSLSGSQVVPAVTTTGSGVAYLGVKLDTGAIAGTLSFSGLSGVATGASINQGAEGTNGPMILALEGGAGALSGLFTVPAGAVLTSDQLLALAADNLYIVVQSGANPDGEIRGQIIPLP
jgi:hypothetical protein